MDEKRIAEAGAKPLQEELDRIAALKDGAGVLKAIAHLQAAGVGPAFSFSAEQDPKDSKRMIAGLGQGGLGLPDRDYYLKDDDETKKTRDAYRAHVEKMLVLLGDDPKEAAAEAGMILELETRLAKASKSNVDLRDPIENYHLMPLDKLESETPGLDWKTYLDDLGLASVKEADLGQPDFFKEVGRAIASTPVDAWKAYLRWNVVSHYASYLSPPFAEENFHFYGTVLNGVPEMQPRWKRVLEATDGLLGEALGQLYVAKAFPPEAKARAEAMVKNIRAALRNDLAHLDWMSPETRQEAVKKVDALTVKIGYPSKWRDYSGLTLDRDAPYVVNVMRGEAFLRKQELDKIGKPTDFAEWEMSPPTVNAYYEPTKNEIVFPAGILQPPFFDAQADDAVNYGAIGAVIGHEMTHGFDDQGRQYDAEGNLRDWWTPADAKAFQERTGQDRRAVRHVHGAGRSARQRQADAGREHRGPRRREAVVPGLQEVAGGEAGAGEDRRLHSGRALLPGLRRDVAQTRSVPRRSASRSRPTRTRRRAIACWACCTTRRSSSRRSVPRKSRRTGERIRSPCGIW